MVVVVVVGYGLTLKVTFHLFFLLLVSVALVFSLPFLCFFFRSPQNPNKHEERFQAGWLIRGGFPRHRSHEHMQKKGHIHTERKKERKEKRQKARKPCFNMTQSRARVKSVSWEEIYFSTSCYFWKTRENVWFPTREVPACESPPRCSVNQRDLCLLDTTSADQIFAFLLTDVH